jgi:3-oxoacyl-[acyl-carrier-protein] synthase I
MTGNSVAVSIAGVGARTAVGLDAPSSAAAVRAGIAGFTEHPELVDERGEPLVVARDPELAADIQGIQRFLDLALPAALEALAPLREWKGRIPPLPVIVGLPTERPGLPKALSTDIAERFKTMIGEHYPVSHVETIPGGHSAGLMALEAGLRQIQRSGNALCLAGGIDCYLEPETLEWLEKVDQFHGAGPHNNAWGFIPGEAAGFCLLSAPEWEQKNGLRSLGTLLSVATAREKHLIKTEEVCLGRGLTEAFREALKALPVTGVQVDHVLCDMNGEDYRADEYGFTVARTSPHFVSAGEFQAPADCWGDVGAASGPLFVSLAVAAGQKGYANGPHTLVWTSSETGERSAALIRVEVKGKR